jgi:hypothetical protein
MRKFDKKQRIPAIFGLICAFTVFSPQPLAAQTTVANLNEAVAKVGQFIAEVTLRPVDGLIIPIIHKVAIINFSASYDLTEYFLRETTYYIEKHYGGNIQLTARHNIDQVLRTLNLTSSSNINDSTASFIGRTLRVDCVATGSLDLINGNYRFRMRLISVYDGRLEGGTDFGIRDTQQLLQLLGTPAAAAADDG